LHRCEVCGKEADKHHIVHRSQGGLDFVLNYKYLCPNHHRGKNGPHKNTKIDISYKLEMQNTLNNLLEREYYTIENLSLILELNERILKKLVKSIRLYKEGYKKQDIIFLVMGKVHYTEDMLQEYEDFEPVIKLA
jgi:hypothetical protein